MACRFCHGELELLRAVAQGTDAPAVPGRRVSYNFPLAAAAMLVLLLGGGLLWSRFIGADAMRGDSASLVLISPSGTVSAPQSLVWHRSPDAIDYRVELVDATDAALLSTTTRDTVLAVPPNLLSSGRTYRWWVTVIKANGSPLTSAPRTFTVR